jgi:hypothetical protein
MGGRWVTLRVDARGDDVDALDCGPGSQGTVRQEIIAGDNGVDEPHRPREAAKAPGTLVTAPIVRVSEENGVVKIENEISRGAPQNTQLPKWQ